MADKQPVYTYTQQTRTILKGSHILIDKRPCKVIEVKYSETTKKDNTKCTFQAYDIFDGTMHEHSARSHTYCDVPFVYDKVYKIKRIYKDGRLVLRPEYGCLKEGFKLPSGPNGPAAKRENGDYLTVTKMKFGTGIPMAVSVKSAMGVERIEAVIEGQSCLVKV